MLKKFLILSFIFSFQFSFAYHVVVDPGHGGVDQGATREKLKESNIALSVGLQLKKLIEQNPDFQITMTRSSDQELSLEKRVEIAHNSNADLLISIHANSSPDLRARGVEFYFQNQLPADEESMYLANKENQIANSAKQNVESSSMDLNKKSEVAAIIEDLKKQNQIQKSFQLAQAFKDSWPQSDVAKKNVIRQAPFFVVNQAKIPSVLVEIGFLTHPSDAQKLANESHHKKIAENIYAGLVKFKEKIDKTPSSTLR